eukprot:CAMPEP_0197034932 /NCGR_PEP_ID=MMETSP1384-20130603/12855_1 /TAXON_ID=29189 /ORGANISM="Ammonia sp." /LENGTH=389 /DNA_ID=CAMNT_0042464903 /DNA_START=48 /DNA_END=1217 /DNA_ORIENTATION=+
MARRRQGHGMTAFKQQELKAWQPVLTPVAVIAMLLIVFVIFLPIGIVLEDCSNRVIEQSWRYDTVGACDEVSSSLNHTQLPKECTLTGPGKDDVLVLDHDYEVPIYFYYELKHFYQNHRRFAKSKSDPQLRGDGNTEEVDPNCEPLINNGGDTLVPCGLFPGSYFEDRFSLDYKLPDNDSAPWTSLCPHSDQTDPCYFWGTGNSTEQWRVNWANWSVDGSWQKQGIAWKSDVDSKFKYVALDVDSQTNQGPRQIVSGLDLPRADDEDFIVWMRAAALPNFRKLHRVIRSLPNGATVLPKGTILRINIASWFPTKDFGGEKWVTIAKTEWCGGANHALAWTYIVVACVAIGLTVTFAVLLLFGSRKMADVERFAWHNRPPPSNSLVAIHN